MMLDVEEKSSSDQHRSGFCGAIDDLKHSLASAKDAPTASDNVGSMLHAESDDLIDRFGGSSPKLQEYLASIGWMKSTIGQQTLKTPNKIYQVTDKLGGSDARMQEYYTSIGQLKFPNTQKYAELARTAFREAMSRSGLRLIEKKSYPTLILPTPHFLQSIIREIPEAQFERRDAVKERFKSLLIELSLKFMSFFIVLVDPTVGMEGITQEKTRLLRWLLEGIREAQKASVGQTFETTTAESPLWREESVIPYLLFHEGKDYPQGERSIRIIRIQLVMNLLAIYLKSNNLSKWNLIFGDSKNDYFNFVDFFLTLRKMEEGRSGSLDSQKLTFTLRRQRTYIVKELRMLPWESSAFPGGAKWPPDVDHQSRKQGLWRLEAVKAEQYFEEALAQKRRKIDSSEKAKLPSS